MDGTLDRRRFLKGSATGAALGASCVLGSTHALTAAGVAISTPSEGAAADAKPYITISSFHYRLEVGREHFALDDPRTGHRLLEAHSPLVFYPEFYNRECNWRAKSVEAVPAEAGAVRVHIRGQAAGGETLRLEIACRPDYIEFAAEADVVQTERVAYWHLFEPGMHLNLFHLHHWRNRHGNTSTNETYNLYQGGKTADKVAGFPPEMREEFTRVFDLTTYSSDWQFAPHPSFLLFQRDSVMLGVGARDLPQGFGLEAKISHQKLEHFRFNCPRGKPLVRPVRLEEV